MDTAKEQLATAIVSVADWMKAQGIEMPSDLAAHVAAIKTQGGWTRILWDDVRQFYHGEQDVSSFLDSMIRTIEDQSRRAWNEGMRNNGLDPAQDWKPEYDGMLQGIIDEQFTYVLDFAQAIEDAQRDGKDVAMFRSRVDLWANRYPDVVNQSMIATKPDDRFVWVLGKTEKHCSTCAALADWVATGKEWQDSGYKPQGSMLECGGWRCDCVLQKVDARSMGVPSV